MTASYPTKPNFEPGNGYTKEDWDAVDSPELTDEELASLKPAKSVMPPEFFEAIREGRKARGRPRIENAKQPVTLRLEPELIEAYRRRGGEEWRALMASELRKAAS